ncbi:MFS transporter [Kiloniella majae]|uniref:MFS transporter n=1 Tax=Kiloniella majae TaxID=1938558 RepID=UPI000A277072|nr:MFS transporter [Kiloniella majae]
MIHFILANARFLAFGFVVAFASSFGQTFYVSLFNQEIRTELNLSHGDFGAFYSAATLISGFAVIWFGKQIDHMDLRLYSYLVILGLFVAALGMVFIPSGLPFLILPLFFLVRLCGQGLMSHISVTAMARYFHDNRGRAISIASLGLSCGEASLPLLTIWLLSLLNWREVWILNAGFLGLVLMPMVFMLLRGHSERDARMNEQIKSQALAAGGDNLHRQWTRREVLRDPAFYLMLPGLSTLAFIVTGIFFHQIHIVTGKGWSMAWFAGNFTIYAAMITISAVMAGSFVDRFGAVRLLLVHIPIFLIGLLFLGLSDHLYTATLFMSFIGISVGFGSTVTSAIWAEVYGTKHIGAIRAMAMSVSVLASALSPALFGWLFDRNVSSEAVVMGCVVWCVLATLCLLGAQRQFLNRKAGA